MLLSAPEVGVIRLLFVDDHADFLTLVERVFGGGDSTVHTAADGARAVALALAEPYDLVVMDVKLPDANGCEVIRALRDAGYKRPIICLTASASDTREQALAAGCDEYYSKPMPLTALKEIVRRKRPDRAPLT